MTQYLDDDLINKINNSNQLTVDERRELIKNLFKDKRFALVQLRQGFPSEDEEAKKYKEPIEKKWQLTSATDNARFPFNKIEDRAGILCGEKSGIFVLDIDNLQNFLAWANERGIENPIPETFTVCTRPGTDRKHYYFKYPTDVREYKNASVEKTFDIRSTGGQVLCPGSIHPETHLPYTVANNHEIVEAPEWMREYSHDRKAFEKRCKEKMSMSKFLNSDGNVDLNKLPVSEDIKTKIQTDYPKGERSDHSMSVLTSLMLAKVPEEIIRKVYQDFPIGDRARGNPDWFEGEIGRAKEFIADKQSEKKKPDMNFYVNTFVCTLNQIANAVDSFEFLIDDFWPKGENLLITGKGGTGKSLFALNMALELACQPGMQFLNNFTVKNKKKVMFFQSENTFRGTKQRINTILQKYPQYQSVVNDILFVGMNQDIRIYGDFNNDKFFRDVILKSIIKYKPEIVIMDPLISFHRQDENSNDKMRYVLDDMTSFFAQNFGNDAPDLCIIHHESKAGQSGGRGASAILDWAANCFVLIENKDKLYLEHKKARNFKKHDKIELAIDSLRFYIGKSQQTTTMNPIFTDIINTLKTYPNSTTTKGQDDFFKTYRAYYLNKYNAEGSSKANFRNELSNMVAQGIVKEIASTNNRINYQKI